MERPQVLDRIQKLMSRTTANGATEAEAQTALAMAQSLMDEHNIRMADLRVDGSLAGIFGEHSAWSSDTLHSHVAVVLPILDEVFAVRSIVKKQAVTGPSGRDRIVGVTVLIFGNPVNVISATWALNFLAPAFRSLWDRHRARTGAKTAAMMGYYLGLRDGFLAKVRDRRATAELAAPGSKNALAVTTGRLDQAFGEAYPECRQIVKSGRDSSAYDDGLRDGQDINLARPIGERGRTQLTA